MLDQPDPFFPRSLDDTGSEHSGGTPEVDGSDTEARHRSGDRCRSKMISFRVSAEELEQLRLRSEADGARNISEYARITLCAGPKPSDPEVRRLATEVQRLEAGVARMIDLLEQRGPLITRDSTDSDRE